MATLTGRTIRSTYDQLIQLEDQLFQDGFGTSSLNGSYSLTGSQFISGNLYINGTASIDYLVSSYESSSIIYSSGSTKFGDTLDDTHEFTGSVTITGSLNSDYISGSFSGSFEGLINSASHAETASYASASVSATSASAAGFASNLSLTVEDSSPSTHYLIFGPNSSGETAPKTDGALSYVPNTETLNVTKIISYLEGTASNADTASLLLGSVENAINAETASLALSTSVTVEISTSFAESGDGPFTGSFSSSLYSLLSGSFTGSYTGSLTGSLLGTSSFADLSTTSSFANLSGDSRTSDSSSVANRATALSVDATASFADSASFARMALEGSGSFSGSFEGDGTNLTGIPGYTVANTGNNRVITSVDATNGNAEANLTFDGTTLTIAGNINTGQGVTEVYRMNQDLRTTDNVTFNIVSASAFTETSTIRSKENIESLNADVIYKLRPVSFDWKNTGKHDIGLIAEETIEHLPEIVQVGADGQAEGIKYTKLTSLLIKAVQDQQKQIEDLKREIRYIENRL